MKSPTHPHTITPPHHPPSTDREAVKTKSFGAASLIAGLMAIGGAVMAFGPTRALAARWLPKPGEGPSR